MALFLKPVNYEELSEREKEAFDDIFPQTKYDRSSPAFSIPEIRWNKIKLDYENKCRDYMAFFHRTETAKYWMKYADNQIEKLYAVSKQMGLCTINVNSHQNINGDFTWPDFERAKIQSNTIRTHYYTDSLESIYGTLINNYPNIENNTDSAINIVKLKHDLDKGILYFTIDDKRIDYELNDFFFMNKFLSTTEKSNDKKELIAPYGKCRALFMVLYYMKRDTACIDLLTSMGSILGSYNAMLSPAELLLPPSDRFASMKQVKLLSHSFPTLVDMQKSYYKFVVLNANDEFFSMGPRLLGMNKISYYDFAEQLDGVKNEYENYLESMIFTFKLLIPDQESFKLAKQIGFIDSSVIDWTFWYHKVVLKDTPTFKKEGFLIESHYEKLVELKRRYFSFFSNLGSDYYKKLVHEPVSLVFNIAAVIFAIAGVIQVLQQANIIPGLPTSAVYSEGSG